VLEKRGIKKVGMATHPEGHPRVPDEVMWPALKAKLAKAESIGLEVFLVSQFLFDAAPVIKFAKRLRADGIKNPYRVGVAGPAKRTTLIKYAMMCGVGASLRALKERHDMAANLMAGETPEGLLREVAEAQAANPSLNIDSVHFFTFGALPASVELAEQLRAG
jgi:methylenetetrahydrofolate reductase (NADPH)